MTVPTSQQQFLSNIHNKSRFITMLKEKFTTGHVLLKQAENDADVLIILVVGEGVDLLVLLTVLTPVEKLFT